ncbi:hypothetical protein IFM89_005694 [Coptis chinensis]|uniref:Uncharacterized protein n=1 Tax=Coptis chinensis TaxID=261450 RepID=A0A835H6Y4_9MAGN|nr:hypothetical protein IFM89_005694 [Coptis chinensis]
MLMVDYRHLSENSGQGVEAFDGLYKTTREGMIGQSSKRQLRQMATSPLPGKLLPHQWQRPSRKSSDYCLLPDRPTISQGREGGIVFSD